jgi:membrane associated rhomboid family serine protease
VLVLPLRDAIPSRTTPYVTVSLIGINAIAFLYEQTLGDWELRAFLMRWGVVPASLDAPSIVTSMFLHASWGHFLGNMPFFWIFSDNVEDRMGHVRFLFLTLACGVVAAVVQAIALPHSAIPIIGASGVVAGVMGAYFVLFPYSRVLTLVWLIFYIDLVEVPALFFLGLWLILQLLFGPASLGGSSAGIALWSHVIGFLAGMGLVVALRRRERMGVEWIE